MFSLKVPLPSPSLIETEKGVKTSVRSVSLRLIPQVIVRLLKQYARPERSFSQGQSRDQCDNNCPSFEAITSTEKNCSVKSKKQLDKINCKMKMSSNHRGFAYNIHPVRMSIFVRNPFQFQFKPNLVDVKSSSLVSLE